MKVLVLDNYDSFTWNLVHGLEVAGGECVVRRSDSLTLGEIEAVEAQRIVLSPGPFGPERAGICSEVVSALGGLIPILGVCLGMQVIAQVAGARVVPSGKPVHGKSSAVSHDGAGLFCGLPNPFQAARYHSLVVDRGSVPQGVDVCAWTDDGTVMGCRWHSGKTEGVLFHPESFLTEYGARIFANFLRPDDLVV